MWNGQVKLESKISGGLRLSSVFTVTETEKEWLTLLVTGSKFWSTILVDIVSQSMLSLFNAFCFLLILEEDGEQFLLLEAF